MLVQLAHWHISFCAETQAMEATAAAQGKGLIIHPTGNHNTDVANLPWSFRIIGLSSDGVLHFHRGKTSSEVTLVSCCIHVYCFFPRWDCSWGQLLNCTVIESATEPRPFLLHIDLDQMNECYPFNRAVFDGHQFISLVCSDVKWFLSIDACVLILYVLHIEENSCS